MSKLRDAAKMKDNRERDFILYSFHQFPMPIPLLHFKRWTATLIQCARHIMSRWGITGVEVFQCVPGGQLSRSAASAFLRISLSLQCENWVMSLHVPACLYTSWKTCILTGRTNMIKLILTSCREYLRIKWIKLYYLTKPTPGPPFVSWGSPNALASGFSYTVGVSEFLKDGSIQMRSHAICDYMHCT